MNERPGKKIGVRARRDRTCRTRAFPLQSVALTATRLSIDCWWQIDRQRWGAQRASIRRCAAAAPRNARPCRASNTRPLAAQRVPEPRSPGSFKRARSAQISRRKRPSRRRRRRRSCSRPRRSCWPRAPAAPACLLCTAGSCRCRCVAPLIIIKYYFKNASNKFKNRASDLLYSSLGSEPGTRASNPSLGKTVLQCGKSEPRIARIRASKPRLGKCGHLSTLSQANLAHHGCCTDAYIQHKPQR